MVAGSEPGEWKREEGVDARSTRPYALIWRTIAGSFLQLGRNSSRYPGMLCNFSDNVK